MILVILSGVVIVLQMILIYLMVKSWNLKDDEINDEV